MKLFDKQKLNGKKFGESNAEVTGSYQNKIQKIFCNFNFPVSYFPIDHIRKIYFHSIIVRPHLVS